MKTPKAGLNKIVLQSVVKEDAKGAIALPEHLKEKKYKVLDIGNPRSTFDNPPTFITNGSTVHLAPSTGYIVKDEGNEYVVCNYDDILLVC